MFFFSAPLPILRSNLLRSVQWQQTPAALVCQAGQSLRRMLSHLGGKILRFRCQQFAMTMTISGGEGPIGSNISNIAPYIGTRNKISVNKSNVIWRYPARHLKYRAWKWEAIPPFQWNTRWQPQCLLTSNEIRCLLLNMFGKCRIHHVRSSSSSSCSSNSC